MKDPFTRNWIIENSIRIVSQYQDGELTIRALHYQLVGIGMTNSLKHYKRVVGAMVKARREGLISYMAFSDHDREMIGDTDWQPTSLESEVEHARDQIKLWMESFQKNRWENQDFYLEFWIEKKALQGIFQKVCFRNRVALCPCKGYPSLTFLKDAADRFEAAHYAGKKPVMVYFGDHDPSGEDIPRSIAENLLNDFGVSVHVDVRALHESQCLELNLPPAPTKSGDSRSANFTGLGQIELDAVPPEILKQWGQQAIDEYFDESLHDELIQQQEVEVVEYQEALKEFVQSL